MAISALVSLNVRAVANPDAKERTRTTKPRGKRELFVWTGITAFALASDSRTQLLDKYLKKSQESKAKNDEERLSSYYKRNYADYFGLLEGNLKQKSESDLTESEKGILNWLERNK